MTTTDEFIKKILAEQAADNEKMLRAAEAIKEKAKTEREKMLAESSERTRRQVYGQAADTVRQFAEIAATVL